MAAGEGRGTERTLYGARPAIQPAANPSELRPNLKPNRRLGHHIPSVPCVRFVPCHHTPRGDFIPTVVRFPGHYTGCCRGHCRGVWVLQCNDTTAARARSTTTSTRRGCRPKGS